MKRKIRSENNRDQRKRQAVDEKEVISLLTPEKPDNPSSDDKQSEKELQNNEQNNSNNNNTKNTNNTSEQNEATQKSQEDPQCGICLDKPTVQGKLDSCTHVFCFECIEHWSKTANTCPFCKARFKSLTRIDLQNPSNNKKPKKVRVRHADQRPEYDDPEEWIVYEDDDEYDDEEGWLDDDLGAWGMPWHGPVALPGNFWSQFLSGSLPADFDGEIDEFIDDDEPDDFIDLTEEPDEIEEDVEFLGYDDHDDYEPQHVTEVDIGALVQQVFHPGYARGRTIPLPRRSNSRSSQISSSSRIRSLRAELRNTRSNHNNNNTNISNNNNNRDSSLISGRTRSQSTNNSNNRNRRNNSNNQRNNSNNNNRRRS